ncbi:hypothetical protein [Streptomyces sp. KM273126]|uniref:hypothetical protein n=1 Tax=Streptomyces sp. KM273126 TaxID=2545247 RepID=UPI00215DAFF8|nr:hypothetical protein [Streptomyces sp. KM273126]
MCALVLLAHLLTLDQGLHGSRPVLGRGLLLAGLGSAFGCFTVGGFAGTVLGLPRLLALLRLPGLLGLGGPVGRRPALATARPGGPSARSRLPGGSGRLLGLTPGRTAATLPSRLPRQLPVPLRLLPLLPRVARRLCVALVTRPVLRLSAGPGLVIAPFPRPLPFLPQLLDDVGQGLGRAQDVLLQRAAVLALLDQID